MTVMYPNGGEVHWVLDGPFGLTLAYPFHRVSDVADGGNLEHLILLTIYLGVAHILIDLHSRLPGHLAVWKWSRRPRIRLRPV